MFVNARLVAISCLSTLLALPALAAAQPRVQSTAESPTAELTETELQEAELLRGPVDPTEIETFVDGYMASHLGEQHVAGAVVTVVRLPESVPEDVAEQPRSEDDEDLEMQSGEVLFTKGYGWADVAERREVTSGTLFRIGSVSKLFTWLSVMQQVEQGELDLDTDINAYLPDLEVPEAFAQPVTLTHLLTHTPGFEDHVIGLFARDAGALRPIGEILRDEMPKRVWPPGETASYSNHGTALAMYAVEQVTGEPWSRYVETEILKPVGLSSTTFAQPPPPELASRLSKGYRWQAGEYQEQGFEFVPLAPAGAVSSSAEDMARFLVSFLRMGETETGRRMLGQATMESMQEIHFRHAPGLNGMAYGLMDLSHNGVRALGHGGDTLWFHTIFAFFPEHRFGLFASFNTDTADTQQFYTSFVENYFPLVELDAPAAEGYGDAARFAGSFRVNRYDHTDIGKLAALMGTVDIEAQEDGSLVTRSGERARWLRESPTRFREDHGERRLVFREDDRGKITHAFLSDLPILALERTPILERPKLHLVLLASSVLLFTLVGLGFPVLAMLRRSYGVVLPEPRKLPTVGRALAWAAALCYLAFMVVTALALSDPQEIVFGVPALLDGALWLPLLGAVFSLGALLFLFSAWRRNRGGFFSRCFFSVVVLAGFVFLWQLFVWNLLGPRL